MRGQLFDGELRMTFRILCGLLDGVIHEIVSGVAVVKVAPCDRLLLMFYLRTYHGEL
jgi:hypothetical protein